LDLMKIFVKFGIAEIFLRLVQQSFVRIYLHMYTKRCSHKTHFGGVKNGQESVQQILTKVQSLPMDVK
jgi:hypothetical protein